MTTVQVLVTPKRTVLDPQGEAVKKTLHSLGLTTALHVSVGKVIELQFKEALSATLEKKLQTICHDLLSNPVIEDYQIIPAASTKTAAPVGPAPVQPAQADYEGLDAEPEGETEELLALETKPKKAAKKVVKAEKKAPAKDAKKKEKGKEKAKDKKVVKEKKKSKEIKDFSELIPKKKKAGKPSAE